MWVYERTASSSLQRGAYDEFIRHSALEGFRWAPSGEMESAEQTGRAPSKLLGRERRALWPLTQARFRGSGEASEKIVQQLQHRRQSLAEVHQRDSTWPDMPSMWVFSHKAPTKRAKDIAC